MKTWAKLKEPFYLEATVVVLYVLYLPRRKACRDFVATNDARNTKSMNYFNDSNCLLYKKEFKDQGQSKVIRIRLE